MKGASSQANGGGKPRIGFITLSPPARPLPSTRIAVLNVLPLLREQGFDANVIYAIEKPTETPELPAAVIDTVIAKQCDIVVLQKMHGPSVLRLVAALEARGIRTVYQVCDLIDAEMARTTSATIVVTEFLRSLYPMELRGRIHVVHDGIEHPELLRDPAAAASRPAGAPLRAVLVTSSRLDSLPVIENPPPWLHVTIVGDYLGRSNRRGRWRTHWWSYQLQEGWRAKLDYLRFVLNPRIALQPWHPEHVYDAMRCADVGIVPIETVTALQSPAESEHSVPSWKVKSENRLTMKMALGLPVVATPIPAYLPVIDHGRNGYLADSRAQFIDSLEQLRDPVQRQRVGSAARASVLVRYSMDEQARKMAAIFLMLWST